MTDRSNGYESVAAEFLAGRGSAQTRSKGIGVKAVREWVRTLPPGAAVIDLGCGPGFPITGVLVSEGLNVYAVDESPSFVEIFRRNLPGIPVACEAVEDSRFFERKFDAAIAWGLIFLLPAEEQRRLIHRVAEILLLGGRLLFTSCAEPLIWSDAMTGLESRSLGAAEYRRQLTAVGLSVIGEYEDEGENHYFDTLRSAEVCTTNTDLKGLRRELNTSESAGSLFCGRQEAIQRRQRLGGMLNYYYRQAA
jgi:SAM-dependent methyltransferase